MSEECVDWGFFFPLPPPYSVERALFFRSNLFCTYFILRVLLTSEMSLVYFLLLPLSFAVFPRIDFSHHPAIQQILFKTCEEFGVEYVAGSWWKIYKEMIVSFRNPQSLMQEIVAQAGGV